MASAVLFAFGCGDAVTDRFEAAAAASATSFGVDERLSVSVSPGAVAAATDAEGVWDVSIHASAPYVDVTFDNGSTDEVVADLRVTNMTDNVVYAADLAPISDDARQAPGCATVAPSVGFSLGSMEATPDGTGGVVRVSVPPCTRVSLSGGPPRDTEVVRLAIVGALDGDTGYLADATLAARNAGVDHIVYVGDAGFADGAARYERVAAAAEDADLPYVVALGRGDADDAGLYRAAFGAADFAAHIGRVRLLVLDTGNARLSDEQIDLITDVPPNRMPGAVVMQVPLFDFGEARGLRSLHQAGRVTSLLARRGFGVVFSASAPTPERAEIGGISYVDVGKGGEPSDRAFAEVVVRRPWPTLEVCVDSSDCDSGFELCERGFCRLPCGATSACPDAEVCDAGFCRTACEAAEDCPGPLPQCEAGMCVLDPQIEVSTVRF